MKIVKRIMPILLGLVFVISSFMTIETLAVSIAKDGLEATLSFDDVKYTGNEEMIVELTVKNTNPYVVENLKSEITLPDEVRLKSGSLRQETLALNPNESKIQEVTLIKKANRVDISQIPADTNKPRTGDVSHVAFYVILMILSGGILLFTCIKRKSLHSKNIISMFLCFMLVGIMSPNITEAAAKTNTFVIKQKTQIDGQDIVVKGKISYVHEKHNSVYINGTDVGQYKVGESVAITADAPEEGKHFQEWNIVTGDVTLTNSNESSTSFIMPDSKVEIIAVYAPNTYMITVINGDNGAISPKDKVDVEYNMDQTFSIVPNIGYHVEDVLVDGKSQGAITEYSFENVKEEHVIEAFYEISYFDIEVVRGDNGMVSPSSAKVRYGGSQTFTFTPYDYYCISDVIVDGNSLGAITEYTFENVKENHKIEVFFDFDPVILG